MASRNPRLKPDSTRAAEKLGELGDPGFQSRLSWKQSLGFLVVTDPSQGRQHVGERWFLLLGVPGAEGKSKEAVTCLVEPNHHQAGEDQRHGRGAFDGLGKTIGRILQTQELLAVFKGAFDGPAARVGGEDLPGGPIELGAVEHLIRSFPLQVAHQDDGQEAVTSGLVVQGWDRLDRQAGMEPELVEVESHPGLVGILGPGLHPGRAFPFLAGPSLGFLRLGRRRFVEGSLGVDTADEVDVGGQVRQDALAARGAVAGDDDFIVGEPRGDQLDEFEGQFRPRAMIRIVLGSGRLVPPLLLLLLSCPQLTRDLERLEMSGS